MTKWIKVDKGGNNEWRKILSKSAHPIFTSGAILISVSVLEYVFQIAISLGNKELFYRTTKKENAWGTWLKITPDNIL